MDPVNSEGKPLIIQSKLEGAELQEQFARAWVDVFGEDGRRRGSIHEYSFLAHQYAGETLLIKDRLLEFFRSTQQLTDYQRAERALKLGWGKWMELRWGIAAKDARDPLKIDQFRLLDQLRRSVSNQAMEEELQRGADVCQASAARRDVDFFKRLGTAFSSERNPAEDEFAFVQAVLANWLTAFWWLMPLKAVANMMAENIVLSTKGTNDFSTVESGRSIFAPYLVCRRSLFPRLGT